MLKSTDLEKVKSLLSRRDGLKACRATLQGADVVRVSFDGQFIEVPGDHGAAVQAAAELDDRIRDVERELVDLGVDPADEEEADEADEPHFAFSHPAKSVRTAYAIDATMLDAIRMMSSSRYLYDPL